MRAIPLSFPLRMRWILPATAGALLSTLFAFAGCGTPAASYPDSPGVTSAQAAWCESLGKIQSGSEPWEHLDTCKGAFPTASAAFLRGMTKCFKERIEAQGDSAPDPTQIVADCTEEVVVTMPAEEASAREVIDARCDRALRCEKVPVDECKAAVTKLEGAQRALFTTRFNGAALHEISGCLASTSCSEESEEAAYDACYKPHTEKLLWFPD